MRNLILTSISLRHGGPEPWDTATQHLALYTCINATNTKTTHHCGDGVANLLPHKTARSPPAKRASGTCVNTVRAHQRAELSCLHRIALACTSIVHRRLSLSSRAISPPILGTFMFEVTRKRRLVRNQLGNLCEGLNDATLSPNAPSPNRRHPVVPVTETYNPVQDLARLDV